MLLVFSTDFGQQSTLFFPQHQEASQTTDGRIDTISTADAAVSGYSEGEMNNSSEQVPVVPVQDFSNQAEGGNNNPTGK